jgi:uncharacterized protein (DUF1778 family)
MRTHRLSIALSEPERALVYQSADHIGETVSGFIRDAAIRAATKTMNTASRAKAA